MKKEKIVTTYGTFDMFHIGHLNLLQRAKKLGDRLIVAVSTDDSRSTAKARALAEGHGWDDFIMLYDKNQEFMRAMNVSLTPQVYVVDADGKIVYSHTGYAPGSELELLKAIKKLQK